MLKKLSCILLSITFCFATLSGCHKTEVKSSDTSKNVLTIAYYDGKYGSKWIQSIASAYKLRHPDIKIKLQADSDIDQKAGALLESAENAPDILFLSNTNWQSWVSKGYIEDLTGLFKTVVDNGKTIEGKIQYHCLTHCKYQCKYWAYPWDDGVTGFVYNKKMFKQNKWAVPTTMKNFCALLPKIKAAGITPIAWDGNDISDWSYVVNNWWAQGEGLSGMANYLAMGSPGVYLQQGRTNALLQFQKIVTDAKNNMGNVLSADSSTAQNLFFGSKAAMLLSGSWIESGAGTNIPKGFSMGIMRTPEVTNAKDAKINVTAAGGFAVISAFSQHKASAKDFLKFMSTDKMLELYTSVTSSPRPFYYDAADTKGLSDFGKGVTNIWQKSNKLYLFSSSPIYYSVFSDWPKNGAPYMQIYSGLTTPKCAVRDNYEYVKKNWADAVKKASE